MIVGLTGGIGSGKTTVGKMFKDLGVPVYNSDQEAKKLMHSSKKVKKAIIDLFGEKAYSKNKLNRDYIASKVFSDENLLKKLNAIVHPAVRKDFSKWMENQKSPYVIQEAAIIFENLAHDRYDKIILITAPLKLRIERIVNRDDTFEKEVLERINMQWSDTKKIALADIVIENVDLDKTKAEVEKAHRSLLEYS